MLAGRTLDARRAAKMGVVDRAVPDRQLKRAAVAMILKQPTLRRPGKLQTLANANIIRSLIAKFLRRELNKKVKRQ